MNFITIRFYEELNDLLPSNLRKKDNTVPLPEKRSIKDVIESFNIPHTEVDLILVNGESVDFEYQLQANDRVSVYPLFESFDISTLQRLRPCPLREPGFICDVHLGKLARKLRLLGFDTLYRNDYPDAEIIDIQKKEERAILTCDRNLLKDAQVRRGYLVRSRNVHEQVREVLRRFDLHQQFRPFSRCSTCNSLLRPASAQEAEKLLPENATPDDSEYKFCEQCEQLYWKGSHYQQILAWIAKLKTEI